MCDHLYGVRKSSFKEDNEMGSCIPPDITPETKCPGCKKFLISKKGRVSAIWRSDLDAWYHRRCHQNGHRATKLIGNQRDEQYAAEVAARFDGFLETVV